MTDLRMITTETAGEAEPILEGYWRRKFDALTEDTIAANLRSLRSQMLTIKNLAEGYTDAEEALGAIAIHAKLALDATR